MKWIDGEAAVKMLRGEAVSKYPSSFVLGILASAGEIEKMPEADAQAVTRCRDCWFFDKKDGAFCTLHEADFSPDAFCSYATTDGKAEYWGLDKADHDARIRKVMEGGRI